jgi:D-tyrosyl-tRNA(Tyr) deacylase
MRAVIQRVSRARVRADGEETGAIGPGLVVLVCAMRGDGEHDAEWLAGKIVKLRIFPDEAGRMNRSIRETGGGILVVSQFTLAAETRGNRPGFSAAAPPEEGERLCRAVIAGIARQGVPVAEGRFGAAMEVELVNDGPVTIWLDTAAR